MKIRPISTFALRVRLRAEGKANVRRRRRLELAVPPSKVRVGAKSTQPMNAEVFVDIHPYAQIGHQVSSWLAGLLWARDLGLDYAGGKLSGDSKGVFRFSAFETEHLKNAKVIRLKAVGDEREGSALADLRAQIARAAFKNPQRALSFRLALDPARWDQTRAQEQIREAVLGGYRGAELLDLESQPPYVAIHIRRGDVSGDYISAGINRWIPEEEYVALIRNLRLVPELAHWDIRVYAMGGAEDFALLQEAGAVLYLGGSRDSDLIALAAARVLVLSPSSFSFTAALVSRSVILGRVSWWHHVPGDGRWVHVSPHWTFDVEAMSRALTVGR